MWNGLDAVQAENSYADRWVCARCGKAFVAESFLDLHALDRHADALAETIADTSGGRPVCPADYCDLLSCAARSVRGVSDSVFKATAADVKYASLECCFPSLSRTHALANACA